MGWIDKKEGKVISLSGLFMDEFWDFEWIYLHIWQNKKEVEEIIIILLKFYGIRTKESDFCDLFYINLITFNLHKFAKMHIHSVKLFSIRSSMPWNHGGGGFQ